MMIEEIFIFFLDKLLSVCCWCIVMPVNHHFIYWWCIIMPVNHHFTYYSGANARSVAYSVIFSRWLIKKKNNNVVKNLFYLKQTLKYKIMSATTTKMFVLPKNNKNVHSLQHAKSHYSQ